MDKPSPGRTGYRVSGSTLTILMTELKLGDIVKMKTLDEIKSKDDLWEVAAIRLGSPQIAIINIADKERNPKVGAQIFDRDLVIKVL